VLPPVIATYVHDLSPVIVRFTDSLQLRWYGLAYLAGFVAVYLLLRWLSRRGMFVLEDKEIGDFVAVAALGGVFVGGRLGYVLFYHVPEHGFSWLLDDPLLLFRVWEGGMASHGGILGLMIVLWIYARRRKVPWTALGDGICIGAPVGLFFGRVANFINGELYGRVTDGPLGIKFPRSLFDEPAELRDQALGAICRADPTLAHRISPDTVAASVREHPQVRQAIEPFLSPRHASQLYEALLEGAVLFALLLWVRLRWPRLAHGVITGLFFILYAVFRIAVEQFREPDSALVLGGAMTKGQFLSLFMIAVGAGFLLHARRQARRRTCTE
jgi:phosphatidylglycerol:prolipoprotein diacylglycerol transferase